MWFQQESKDYDCSTSYPWAYHVNFFISEKKTGLNYEILLKQHILLFFQYSLEKPNHED